MSTRRGLDRRFWPFFLGFALLYLGGVLTFLEDVSWSLVVAGVCNVIAGASWMVAGRTKTTVNSAGISVTNLRTRFFPWDGVEDLKDNAHGRWTTSVRALLTDGVECSLPGMRPEDVREAWGWKRPPNGHRGSDIETTG